MKDLDIVKRRLANQRLIGSQLESAHDVVSWFGAVQAQDYPATKWAVNQRMKNGSNVEIEKAYAEGSILRTHVMRPTWHFVAAEDIRWMLKLTAPRVHAMSAYYYRQQELDAETLKHSTKIITKALEGRRQLTRDALTSILDEKGISTHSGIRSAFILAYNELEGVICSGVMKGKKHTYALLEERVPKTQILSREESLSELAKRYFTSHGPATLYDFSWWSGLSLPDVKKGVEMNTDTLIHEGIDGQKYWFSKGIANITTESHSVLLLPNYDEYTIAYKDRNAFLDPLTMKKVDSRNNIIFNNSIVIDGKIVGGWKRTVKTKEVFLTIFPFRPFSSQEETALYSELKKYEKFIGLPVKIERSLKAE